MPSIPNTIVAAHSSSDTAERMLKRRRFTCPALYPTAKPLVSRDAYVCSAQKGGASYIASRRAERWQSILRKILSPLGDACIGLSGPIPGPLSQTGSARPERGTRHIASRRSARMCVIAASPTTLKARSGLRPWPEVDALQAPTEGRPFSPGGRPLPRGRNSLPDLTPSQSPSPNPPTAPYSSVILGSLVLFAPFTRLRGFRRSVIPSLYCPFLPPKKVRIIIGLIGHIPTKNHIAKSKITLGNRKKFFY